MEKNKKSYKQNFVSLVPTYSLDQETNRLVKTGLRDVEKEINSHYETCLDYILDKFLNSNNLNDNFNVIETDSVIDVPLSQSKIDGVQDAFIYNEELRSKYNIPDNISNSEIPGYLEKIKNDVVSRINYLKELEKLNRKVDVKDEKEIEEKTE